jgi:hypothetical protein
MGGLLSFSEVATSVIHGLSHITARPGPRRSDFHAQQVTDHLPAELGRCNLKEFAGDA